MKEVLSLFTLVIRSGVFRGVLCRPQAERRQCSPRDEQARVLQHGSFAYTHFARTSLPYGRDLTSSNDREYRA